MVVHSLISRLEEPEEEKGPGFSHSRMHVFIFYFNMCTHGRARNKSFHCHMVSSLISIVYSKLKQGAQLCASIAMSVINACRLCRASVRSKNSLALLSTTEI